LQREEKADESSGEIYVETTPEDIEAAFGLLSDTLFRKSDELSGACRSFYDWLHGWAKGKRAKGFTGAEIRKDLRIHPRMVQRYLVELSTFGLIKLVGGHPRKGGYSYAITGEGGQLLQRRIEEQIGQVLARVRDAHTTRSVIVQAQAPAPKRTRKEGSATVRQAATIEPLSH
jgi:hypothetical protein